MTKQDLKKVIAEQRGISQKQAEEYIEAVFEGIKEGLKQDGKVALQGLINFEIKETKASSGVLNGIEWEKPAGHKVTAKVSDVFQKEVLE